MIGGVRVGKGTALAANEVVEYENDRVLSAKRKAQAAKDRVVEKRATTEGASHRLKKKKTAPLSIALSDSEADGSNRSGFVNELKKLQPMPSISMFKSCKPPNINRRSMEVPNLRIEAKKQDKRSLEAITRHTNPKTPFRPILAQRLLFSDEYKKSMSDVFNLAISARWLEGVKSTCSEEEVEAFLATSVDYDPECKTTFMSAFVSLLNKSYPYTKKLVESFRLPFGGSPKYMAGSYWAHSKGALNSSGASCVSGNVRHLAIGTWSHPERLVFWVMCVTWPLALGLIRSVFAYRLMCVTFPLAFRLIRSVLRFGASCVPSNVCHLSIGAWTHPERLALQVTYVAWPLVLGLIRGVEQLSG
nr:hypothetical protein [Tanacetum cinerariifolium]